MASTANTTTNAELPPPTGPLDPLVSDRVRGLELDQHEGAPELRRTGSEDARNLDYSAANGRHVAVTLARFPTGGLARRYASQYASVLASDHGFEPKGKPQPFQGAAGAGTLIRLDNGKGTAAAVWTTGPLFAAALANRSPLRTLLENAPFGEAR